MKVIQVNQTDIINNKPNNVIIFNKETQSYFKKDSSVTLTSDITFRDAILGLYSEWARFREKEIESDFVKYYDNTDKIKLLSIYNESDSIRAIEESRKSSFDITTVLDTLPQDKKDSFNASKTLIDNVYLENFSKVIYVSQESGLDTNIGTETSPIKTIRRAESLVIENTAIIVGPGVYDITKGNTQSNKRYCISGLAGNSDNTTNFKVEYINMNNIGDVTMVVDTNGLDFEARDITFINGMRNSDSKVIGITFKMVDSNKTTNYSSSIVRNSEGVQIIDCVFDLNVLNGNITYQTLVGRDSIVFKNSIIDFKKTLNDAVSDTPHSGKYETERCLFNEAFRNKLENFDSKATDIRGEVSLLSQLNTIFF